MSVIADAMETSRQLSELKPCKKCGSEPEAKEDPACTYHIRCPKCKEEMSCGVLGNLLMRWNRKN